MPVFLLGGMAIAGGISSYFGGKGAEAEAYGKQLAFEESEFQRQLQNSIQNRNIAKANAAKHANNWRIEEWANQTQAERFFWARYNFDNESSAYGEEVKVMTDQLLSRFSGKNVDTSSGTAQAILRNLTNKAQEQAEHRRVGFGVELETAKRERKQALASRDFNFNEHIPFLPGAYGGPTPGQAFTGAFIGGLASTASGVMGAAYANT